jgi:hypothetical protein
MPILVSDTFSRNLRNLIIRAQRRCLLKVVQCLHRSLFSDRGNFKFGALELVETILLVDHLARQVHIHSASTSRRLRQVLPAHQSGPHCVVVCRRVDNVFVIVREITDMQAADLELLGAISSRFHESLTPQPANILLRVLSDARLVLENLLLVDVLLG